MSTASLHVVRLADLPAVVAAGPEGALAALRAHGEEADDAYFWSGHHLLFLIQHLWRRHGVSLFSLAHQHEESLLNDDARGVTVIIVGPEHKPLLPRLDPSTHDAQELAGALIAWGVRAREAHLAAMDGITLLHEQIQQLPEDSVLVVHVG